MVYTASPRTFWSGIDLFITTVTVNVWWQREWLLTPRLAWWHSLTGVKASQVLPITFRKRQIWLLVLLCKQFWPHGFPEKVFRGSQGPHFENSCSGWTHSVLTRPHLLLRQCTRISSFSLLNVRSPLSTVIPHCLHHAVICPHPPFPSRDSPYFSPSLDSNSLHKRGCIW